MSVPRKILAAIKPFVKGTTKVPVAHANKSLLEYRALVKQLAKRSANRQAMRAALNKNVLTANFSPKYQKLLGTQAKAYGKEVVDDVMHPAKTFKRQIEMIKHHVDPNGQIVKRSPMGAALMGSFLIGAPLYYGAEELSNPNPEVSAHEKLVRAAATGVTPLLTPKAIPSMLAMSAPDAVYRKKDNKKRGIQRYTPTKKELLDYYDSIASLRNL